MNFKWNKYPETKPENNSTVLAVSKDDHVECLKFKDGMFRYEHAPVDYGWKAWAKIPTFSEEGKI